MAAVTDLPNLSNELYAAVGTLAVLLWDILLHLPQDYALATRHPFNLLFLNHCIARVTSLAWVLGVVIITTAPVGNCDYARQINILYPFTIPLSIMPLVVRVFALYKCDKYIVASFSTAWLCVLAACIAVPIGSYGISIGTTKYCDHGLTGLANALSLFCPFIHDSFLFGATSLALVRNSHSGDTVKNGIRVMVFGRDLPAFSRAMLREGQAYYLVILIFKLFFIVVSYRASTVRVPCTFSVVIANNMCSYLYRNMRLGFYSDYTMTTSEIEKVLEKPSHSQHPGMMLQKLKTKCPKDGDLEAGIEDDIEEV